MVAQNRGKYPGLGWSRYVKVRNYNDWANSSPGLQSFTLVTLFCHVAVVFCLLWCDDLQSHVMIPTSDC